ncbi:MAG: carboxymuconolactone decarboxylase family protein [Haloarculaceae archaeon]
MALLDYVDPATADERTRDLLGMDGDYFGRPSLFARALAIDPDVFAARTDYYDRIARDSEIPTLLCELVFLGVPLETGCTYCIASHSEKLLNLGVPRETVEAFVHGDLSGFDQRERAVIRFAQTAARDPASVDEAHLEALRESGFDDPAVVRLLTIVAAAVAANTIADVLSLHPDDREEPFAGDPSWWDATAE